MCDEMEWAESFEAIYSAGEMASREKEIRGFGSVVDVDRVMLELKLVYTFLGYAHVWSNKSACSASHNNEVKLIAEKVRELTVYLATNFINRSTTTTAINDAASSAQESSFTSWLSWGAKRESVPSLLDVFSYLNREIARLKPIIREAVDQDFFSIFRFQVRPPSCRTRTDAWYYFCEFVKWTLQHFSNMKFFYGVSLRKQMESLQESIMSVDGLLHHHAGDCSPWKDAAMAHFGRMVMKVAHICCCYWYVRVEHTMMRFLPDLSRKMDPASPEFLEATLGFLGHHDSETSISCFVSDIIGILYKGDVLHKELISLLPCFIKIPKMHRIAVGIKNVVMETRYLKDKNQREHKADFALLLANIWSLKAEISIRSCGTLLTLDVDGFVNALHEGSAYLGAIFTPAQGRTENQILKLIEQLPGKAQSLFQSQLFVPGNEIMNEHYKFLVVMMLYKAKTLLSELLENNDNIASLLLPLKRQIGTLRQGLFILIELVINAITENTEDEKLILTDMEVVALGVISLCKEYPADKVSKAAASVTIMESWLSDLLEKFRHLSAKLRGLYLQIPMSNFPKTPGLCFIELLLQNLRNLLSLKHDSELEAYSTHQFEAFCSDLEFIISSFGDVFEQGIENQECKDLHTRLVNVAYQAEYAIDLMVDANEPVWQHSLWLYHLSEETRNIKMQLEDSYGKTTCDDGLHNVPQRLIPFASQVTTTRIEEVMVGLSDEKEVIIDRLIRGTLQRHIVSIVGMAGIGKTTLAKNVFCSPSVMCHFPIRAWCCVSQTYKKRDLLLNILSHVITVTDNTHEMSDDDLGLVLYKQLKKIRYLIVMDDVWSLGAWYDLQLSFSDDSNGSRILFTSRLQDVVSKFSDPHPLRPLSEEESWELLKMKIFGEEGCPEELLEVGQQIAHNCKGLPLAIGAIAGLLDKTNRKQDLWQQIAASVSSRVVNDPETQCKEILELSYKHLPNHLKACLLYFGAFPDDKDIPVRRLQWLWIAEGFVRKLESKSLEDLAEGYFMELVGRSLVTVAKRRSNGRAKTCRLHDVIRDLCLLKAKDDKFLQLISGNDEPYSCFDSVDYGIHYDLFTPSNSITYKEYRLCFCVNREQFVASRPSGPFVRSLLFHATNDMYPRCPFDVSFISNNFKRLRVLDLESINMGNSFANGIVLLLNLRYLAVCGDMESIPSSLSDLENLETLLVKGLKSKVMLPDSIWRMKNLRHVHVSNRAVFTFHNDENGRTSQLVSLVTLSLPCFSYAEETNGLIMRFPNLRKLKCMLLEPRDVSKDFCQFPALESLCQLESLKMSYYGKALNPGEMNLPSSLKKLTLSNFRLPWNHMSAIGRLQMLEVLKLICEAFEGGSWDMTEGEFLKLKYLELDSLKFVHWDAYSDHLPQLEQLVLRNCKKLEEVPYDFVNISTLQKIEVQQCGISVEGSVRKIEEQEIEGLKIVIHNSYSA